MVLVIGHSQPIAKRCQCLHWHRAAVSCCLSDLRARCIFVAVTSLALSSTMKLPPKKSTMNRSLAGPRHHVCLRRSRRINQLEYP